MKNFIFVLTCLFSVFSFFKAQTLENHLQIEVDKWQKELVLNGEVGPRCYNDYNKWMQDYPNYYYGLQDIKYYLNPSDSDEIKDALFFFDAVNCVGGSSGGSDFAVLVYSNNGFVLTNKNITTTIENKIKQLFADNGNYDIERVQIYYKSYLGGEFSAWKSDDANCCASYNGKFKYNPSNFTVKLSK